jgi:hypothetical protein
VLYWHPIWLYTSSGLQFKILSQNNCCLWLYSKHESGDGYSISMHTVAIFLDRSLGGRQAHLYLCLHNLKSKSDTVKSLQSLYCMVCPGKRYHTHLLCKIYDSGPFLATPIAFWKSQCEVRMIGLPFKRSMDKHQFTVFFILHPIP